MYWPTPKSVEDAHILHYQIFGQVLIIYAKINEHNHIINI